MLVRLLTKQEYHATFRGKMSDVTNVGDATVDIWPYAAEVARDLEIVEYSSKHELVEYVYRTEDSEFDHVLIPSNTKNVYLAVIVDLLTQSVHGHFLLDLNEEYGINSVDACPKRGKKTSFRQERREQQEKPE